MYFPEASLSAPHGGSPWLDEGSWFYPLPSLCDGDTQSQDMSYREGMRPAAAHPGQGLTWFCLKANSKHVRPTRLMHSSRLLLVTGVHGVKMFLCSYVKLLKARIEIKTRQSTRGWACQWTRVLCVGKEMAFTSVSKEILPEMSALVLKKGMGKIIKCSIKETLLFFSCRLFGSFWSENVYFLFLYWDNSVFYHILLWVCISHSECLYQCRSGAVQPSHVSRAAGIRTGVKV